MCVLPLCCCQVCARCGRYVLLSVHCADSACDTAVWYYGVGLHVMLRVFHCQLVYYMYIVLLPVKQHLCHCSIVMLCVCLSSDVMCGHVGMLEGYMCV